MYKDLISYELAEGVSLDQLKSVAIKVHSDWMSKQKGFVSWEINETGDGSLMDIVVWESKEDADLSNEKMAGMPHGGEWMACYKMKTIKSTKLYTKIHF